MLPYRTLTSTALARRLWVVWLAVWLALFAALAPSLSYAFQAAANRDAADLHAVCSGTFNSATPGAAPSAPVWWQSDSPQSDDSVSPESTGMCGNCPLCLLSVDRLAPPPVSLLGIAIQAESRAVPVAPQPQFAKGFLELNPPPRGPPVLS